MEITKRDKKFGSSHMKFVRQRLGFTKCSERHMENKQKCRLQELVLYYKPTGKGNRSCPRKS
jgi:hypothetical protein